jgi:hypothetical protein
VIGQSNFIIIADHFTVSVKIYDPWPDVIACIEAARDYNSFCHPDKKIERILRAGFKIFPGIKKKS